MPVGEDDADGSRQRQRQIAEQQVRGLRSPGLRHRRRRRITAEVTNPDQAVVLRDELRVMRET